jgi:HAD superfamily hydrolase (TIGR01549 family)
MPRAAPKVVLIDAMFTIFTPKNGLSRLQITQNLIKKLLGRKTTSEKLKKVYAEKRKKWERKLPARHSDKWTTINREIILALFPDVPFEKAERAGRKISLEFLTNADFYTVLNDTRIFLQKARERGIRIIIASNQDKNRLKILLRRFNLNNLFHAVYTSTEIGAEKPEPRFFQAILKKEKLKAGDCLMVGNNPKNDVWGARRVGIQPILYLKEKRDDVSSDCKIIKRLTEILTLV